MSLHKLANHIQSAGRGEDKVLVHMTPKEVHGLQALAMASGGSLTINPHTGLYEAGWLSKLLPMIAGAVLTPFTGPLGAALMVGAVKGLATGSLKEGLTAGLGAYGGAGIGQGLTAAGAEAAKAGATEAASAGLPSIASGSNLVSQEATTMAQGLGQAGTPAVAQSTVPTVSPAVQTAQASSQLAPTAADKFAQMGQGLGRATSLEGLKAIYAGMPAYSGMAAAMSAANAAAPSAQKVEEDPGMIRPYEYSRTQNQDAYSPYSASGAPAGSSERNYFTDSYLALAPYKAPGPEYKNAASGGIMALANGGPVEEMSAMNAVGANTQYPMASLQASMYSNPAVQRPTSNNVLAPSADTGIDPYTGEQRMASGGKTKGSYTYTYDPKTLTFTQTSAPVESSPTRYSSIADMMAGVQQQAQEPAKFTPVVTGGISAPAMASSVAQGQPQQPHMYSAYSAMPYKSPEEQLGLSKFYDYMNQQLAAKQGYAAGGGVSHLGDYSDGGRLLKGPGDGVSDSIPASIGDKQPARLADGEFVVPARIVSELGNGSTEAGARRLYAMMDRVQKARSKSVGKGKVAVNSNAERYLPA